MSERVNGYDVEYLPSEAQLEIKKEAKRLSQEDYKILDEYWSGYEVLAKRVLEGNFNIDILREFGFRLRSSVLLFEFELVVEQAKLEAEGILIKTDEYKAVDYLKTELHKVVTCAKPTNIA